MEQIVVSYLRFTLATSQNFNQKLEYFSAPSCAVAFLIKSTPGHRSTLQNQTLDDGALNEFIVLDGLLNCFRDYVVEFTLPATPIADPVFNDYYLTTERI